MSIPWLMLKTHGIPSNREQRVDLKCHPGRMGMLRNFTLPLCVIRGTFRFLVHALLIESIKNVHQSQQYAHI